LAEDFSDVNYVFTNLGSNVGAEENTMALKRQKWNLALGRFSADESLPSRARLLRQNKPHVAQAYQHANLPSYFNDDKVRGEVRAGK
jgi:hypothetical protein